MSAGPGGAPERGRRSHPAVPTQAETCVAALLDALFAVRAPATLQAG